MTPCMQDSARRQPSCRGVSRRRALRGLQPAGVRVCRRRSRPAPSPPPSSRRGLGRLRLRRAVRGAPLRAFGCAVAFRALRLQPLRPRLEPPKHARHRATPPCMKAAAADILHAGSHAYAPAMRTSCILDTPDANGGAVMEAKAHKRPPRQLPSPQHPEWVGGFVRSGGVG